MAKATSRHISQMKPAHGVIASLLGGGALTALFMAVHYKFEHHVTMVISGCQALFCGPHYELWQYYGAPFPIYFRTGLSASTTLDPAQAYGSWMPASVLFNFLFFSAFLGLAFWLAYRKRPSTRTGSAS